MRGAWLIVFAGACAPVPANAPGRGAARTAAGPAPCFGTEAAVKARIAYVRDDASDNFLEIETRGPSCNALAACRRLVTRESDHALPSGFSAVVQQPCHVDVDAGEAATASSTLPYELVDSEPAESEDASVRARYSWIERFARAEACEASRDAHEARRRREALEMRRALGAAAAPAAAPANELACRRVLGGD